MMRANLAGHEMNRKKRAAPRREHMPDPNARNALEAKRGALAIAIPCLDEGANLAVLLPEINAVIKARALPAQVFVFDGGSKDGSQDTAQAHGAEVIVQRGYGYGGALFTAIQYLPAEFILTLDADLSHPADVIAELYAARHQADIVIASRYVPGGRAEMTLFRAWASRFLNRVLRRRLKLEARDITSGYRIYRRAAVINLPLRSEHFAVLPELLARAKGRGATVAEIPFTYRPRKHGTTHVRLWRFAREYVPLLLGWTP